MVLTIQLHDPLTNSKSVTLYTLQGHSPSTWGLKWESDFQIVKCFIPHTAVLDNTINGKFRSSNKGDICFTVPLDILQTENYSPHS